MGFLLRNHTVALYCENRDITEIYQLCITTNKPKMLPIALEWWRIF